MRTASELSSARKRIFLVATMSQVKTGREQRPLKGHCSNPSFPLCALLCSQPSTCFSRGSRAGQKGSLERRDSSLPLPAPSPRELEWLCWGNAVVPFCPIKSGSRQRQGKKRASRGLSRWRAVLQPKAGSAQAAQGLGKQCRAPLTQPEPAPGMQQAAPQAACLCPLPSDTELGGKPGAGCRAEHLEVLCCCLAGMLLVGRQRLPRGRGCECQEPAPTTLPATAWARPQGPSTEGLEGTNAGQPLQPHC